MPLHTVHNSDVYIIFKRREFTQLANIFPTLEDISRYAVLFTALHKETRTA